MDDEVGIIAKTEEDALAIMYDLQREFIIGAFDEEYTEVDNKKGAIRLAAGIGLSISAIYANGSFDDDDEIVRRIIKRLDQYMADDDFLFTYSYEAA